jgi:hypothetical protein
MAEIALASEPSTIPLRLHPTTLEREHYWVFPFNTVTYFETNNPLQGLAGAGPIVISKSDGSVRFLAGDRPFDEQL